MSSESLRVLVIEDDPDTRANVCDILELDEHRVATAGSVAEALARGDWAEFAVVILDRRLPDGSADELLPRIRQLAPQAGIIVVTGYADVEGAITALRRGASDYILKPINPDALRASLHRLIERQQLAQAKERSETAFRTLIEAADCMIVMLRPDGRTAYFSRFAEETTDRTFDEVRDADWFDVFVDGDHRPAVRERLLSVLDGTPLRGWEVPVLHRDGTLRWILWNARLLSDYDGEPAILMVGQDITEHKEAEARSLQAERLAAIGQMVTGLAHESRNALQRSQACLDVLAEELREQPDALDLVQRMQRAQQHLHHLYEEVRGYAAPIRIRRERCHLPTLWRETWSNLAVSRGRRAVHLIEQIGRGDPVWPVDPHAMEQVFRNVFENALAVCEEPGCVIVSCRRSAAGTGEQFEICIADNGPGLTPEQQKRICEPFFTTKTHGTGLGMAIVRRIVEGHGGIIRAENGPERGARVVITLPAA